MRNLGLDISRFAAVILVLGNHMKLAPGASEFWVMWNQGGWIGVDLFFVLSGFLVSGLLFKEFRRDSAINIRRFLIRRGFKIYPAFYAMILFTVFAKLLQYRSFSYQKLISELLFVQNYFKGFWNHTWSLAIEEHFYFGIAILCAIFIRRYLKADIKTGDPFKFIPIVFFILAGTCLAFRIPDLFETYRFREFLAPTHKRVDSLFFGTLLAYLWHFQRLEERIKIVSTPILILLGTVMLFPAFCLPRHEHQWISVFGPILFYLGSGLIILGMIRIKNSTSKLLKLAGYFGAASYSIYLWHMPLQKYGWVLINKALSLNDSFVLYFLFYIFGSLVFGVFMNKLIEVPLIFIRDRFFPASQSGLAVEQVAMRNNR